jgi:hypothetical protein
VTTPKVNRAAFSRVSTASITLIEDSDVKKKTQNKPEEAKDKIKEIICLDDKEEIFCSRENLDRTPPK